MSCNAKNLTVGTKFSRTSYGEIVEVIANGTFVVKNEEGKEWQITGDIVAEEFFTPDQYDDAFELTRTELFEELLKQQRIVMTVFFTKKPDHKKLVLTVEKLMEGDQPCNKRELSKILKEATTGEERTMIGRHYGAIDEFGRLQFVDMENKGLRLVDPRTVEWFIAGNIKYVLK